MEIIKDYKLILLNDEVNSFPYIMACLIRFCMHEPIQAEQCALIADNVGHCTIKYGSYYTMENMKDQLTGLNIQVKLEVNEGNMY
jgi:ATP-dependent Clp protease adaptor protein ClpS